MTIRDQISVVQPRISALAGAEIAAEHQPLICTGMHDFTEVSVNGVTTVSAKSVLEVYDVDERGSHRAVGGH
jgi:hypothetical protein